MTETAATEQPSPWFRIVWPKDYEVGPWPRDPDAIRAESGEEEG